MVLTTAHGQLARLPDACPARVGCYQEVFNVGTQELLYRRVIRPRVRPDQ